MASAGAEVFAVLNSRLGPGPVAAGEVPESHAPGPLARKPSLASQPATTSTLLYRWRTVSGYRYDKALADCLIR